MERCPVCGARNFVGMVCPDCGFDESRNYETYMTLVPLKDGSIPSVAGRKAAWEEEQKRIQVASLEILLEVYYYNVEDEKITLDRDEKLLLAKGTQLVDGDVYWSDTVFPRVEEMDQLPITLYLKRGDESRRCRLVIDNPGGNADWRVGVKYYAGKHPEAELLVGAEGAIQTSDRFSLEG